MRPLTVLCALALVGCEGGNDINQPTPVASVVLSPAVQQAISVGGTVSLSAQPKDAQGNNLSRAISWSTANQAKVSISSTTGTTIIATGLASGWSMITATSGGRSARVLVEVKFPSWAVVAALTDPVAFEDEANSFRPPIVNIAAGGTVTWTFDAVVHNVTFGANKPIGGDIPDRSNTTESRIFPAAGAYKYTCTIHGPWMSGTVNVY